MIINVVAMTCLLRTKRRRKNQQKTIHIEYSDGITEADSGITCTRLPTDQQLLHCLTHYFQRADIVNRQLIKEN